MPSIQAKSRVSSSEPESTSPSTSWIAWSSDGSVRFVIPTTPSPALNKNARRQWARIVATKDLRTLTRYAAISVFNGKVLREPSALPVFRGDVQVEAEVFWEKSRRICDNTNLIGMLSPVWDGMQDVGIVENDQQIKKFHVEQFRDPDGSGYTVITVRGIAVE